jgi:large subunit ribosomal protein L21
LSQEVSIVYAVIRSGGKQYRVAEGEVVRLEKLESEPGASVEFDEILLIRTDDRTYVGRPRVAGARVIGTVAAGGLGDKVIVFKYKPKKQYRRTRGHRQPYSDVLINKIEYAAAQA